MTTLAAIDFEFAFAANARPWDYRQVIPVCAVIEIDGGKQIRACPMMGTPFSVLTPYLADSRFTFVCHHYHAEWNLLRSLGLMLPATIQDTETAARYLDIRDKGFLNFRYDLLTCMQRAGFPVRESWWKVEMQQRIASRDFSDLKSIVQYCADDVHDTMLLAKKQHDCLDSNFWQLIQPLQLRLLEIYDRGLTVDVQSYGQLQEHAELILHKQQRRLIDLGFQGSFMGYEKLTHPRHNRDVQRSLMIVGLDEILDELPVHKRDEYKFGWQRKSVAGLFKSHHHESEFLRAATTYHATIDLLRYDWRQFIDSDHKVRFGFTFPGSSSFRISPRMPHPLMLPKIFRPVLTASPGNALLEIDFACQEFVLAGVWYDDPNMIRLFNGYALNLYAEVGHAMGLYPDNNPDSDPALLDKIKIAILAMIYGAGNFALRENLQCSDEEATRIRRAFHNTFPALMHGRENYLRAIRSVGFAWNCIDLRRCYHEFRLTEIGAIDTDLSFLNYPIQSGGSMIMARLLFDMPSDIHVVASCHDSILIECPNREQDLREVFEVASKVMKNAMDSLFPGSKCRVKPVAGERFHKKPDSLHRFCAQFGLELKSPIGSIFKL